MLAFSHEELKDFADKLQKDKATYKSIGMLQAGLFLPNKRIPPNDYTLLQTIALSVIFTISDIAEVDDEIFIAVASAIASVYEMGRRRGKKRIDSLGNLIPVNEEVVKQVCNLG